MAGDWKILLLIIIFLPISILLGQYVTELDDQAVCITHQAILFNRKTFNSILIHH